MRVLRARLSHSQSGSGMESGQKGPFPGRSLFLRPCLSHAAFLVVARCDGCHRWISVKPDGTSAGARLSGDRKRELRRSQASCWLRHGRMDAYSFSSSKLPCPSSWRKSPRMPGRLNSSLKTRCFPARAGRLPNWAGCSLRSALVETRPAQSGAGRNWRTAAGGSKIKSVARCSKDSSRLEQPPDVHQLSSHRRFSNTGCIPTVPQFLRLN